MSGGVDSSVTAALLLKEGYDVVGVTMKVWPQECSSRAEDKCCGPQAIADARAVAHSLGIPHYVVDDTEEFNQTIIGYFATEYRHGRTPNPCILCNEKLKFGSLRERARRLGASFVATGHYARIEHADGRAFLRRGLDPRKDQSYFLFSLRQEQLLAALTPIGAHTKTEIREMARQMGLKTHDKQDSQEICFVPDNDYAGFLRSHFGTEGFQSGGIYDLQGRRLGDHTGIENYTIGQRKGLPGGSPKPLYVVDIDPVQHRIIVGFSEDLTVASFRISGCNWILPRAAGETLEATVKIRYNHSGCPARLHILDDTSAEVTLPEPQRAVTPGQAAVFYDADLVLGGGWIERHSPLQPISPIPL
jgi:tRNA-specific 2-thiouridylase